MHSILPPPTLPSPKAPERRRREEALPLSVRLARYRPVAPGYRQIAELLASGLPTWRIRAATGATWQQLGKVRRRLGLRVNRGVYNPQLRGVCSAQRRLAALAAGGTYRKLLGGRGVSSAFTHGVRGRALNACRHPCWRCGKRRAEWHHVTYVPETLAPLCKSCHRRVHHGQFTVPPMFTRPTPADPIVPVVALWPEPAHVRD